MLADATRLPFRDASFPAALIVHVLHLVSDWRAVIAEIKRVLAPGGALIHDRTRYAENNPWHRTFQKREGLLAGLGFVARPRPAPTDVATGLEAIGGTLRTVEYAENVETEVASEVLKRARNRVDSWTWEIPDDIYQAFLPQYEAYVLEDLGGPDAKHATQVTYTLEVWTFS
jgi:SAM-dependent methyltransferase